MNRDIRMKAGACTLLFAGLITTGPTVAKVTIECKNPVTVTWVSTVNDNDDQLKQIELWKQAVASQYGAYWADSSRAKSFHHNCTVVGRESICTTTAAPCAPVKPPSSSASNPEPPPARTTRLPEPSDSDPRTTSPGRRTGGADQPSEARRLPSAGTGPGRDTPASPGSAGPRRN